MLVGEQGRSDSGHCSLAAMWSKDPGLARGSRKFRIITWPLTSAPAIIPLDLQLRLASIATESPDGNLRRLLRRHAKLLQLWAACKGRSQDVTAVRAGQINYLKPLAALTGCRPHPTEVWRQRKRDDASSQEQHSGKYLFGLVGS